MVYEPTIDDLELINELYPTTEEEYEFYLSALRSPDGIDIQAKLKVPEPCEIIRVDFQKKQVLSRQMWI